jgi:hypothetical protein
MVESCFSDQDRSQMFALSVVWRTTDALSSSMPANLEMAMWRQETATDIVGAAFCRSPAGRIIAVLA